MRHARRNALAVALFAMLGSGAPHAGEDLAKPPPLAVPLFDGNPERTLQPPAGALQRPLVPDYRQLFDLVVACWPAKSWFRGELYMEGRIANKSSTSSLALDPDTGSISNTGARSIALVARIPLISATELDKERNRELERRTKIADAVGNLVSAFAERVMVIRELKLLQALEKRAQERVRMGVAETAEQVRYLEQVSILETKIQILQSNEIKAKLHVLGMCDETNMGRIDAYLATFNQVK